nr:phytase [uncultured Carboxylicivirga sp.]
MKHIIIIFSAFIILATGCNHKTDKSEKKTTSITKMNGDTEAIEDSIKKANALALQSQIVRAVSPKAETQPVSEKSGVDAADDPAIWYNEANPAESRILGTDKKSGLGLYNLDGELIYFARAGKVNNVDIRYNFEFNGRKIAIAAATERISKGIVLFEVTADSLISLLENPILLDSTILDDAYGCCMYYSRKKAAYYAFVCGKNGNLQQWKITDINGNINAEAVRNITLSSQCEGMVADDEQGILYVAEEGKAIWKISAEEDADNTMSPLAQSDSSNPYITYDLEGLDIYYAGNNKGYLIASVQGNFTYAIFEKEGDNKYLGNFIIKSNNQIDGTEETDGLAVTNINLGNKFPKGLLVVQDGFNTDNGVDQPQNFKLVDWADLATVYEPNLAVSPQFKWWDNN